jgi:hypothetical protein
MNPLLPRRVALALGLLGACSPDTPTEGADAATTADAAHDAGSDAPLASWYRDLDGDGYGDPAERMAAAAPPPGYVFNSGDCDDTSLDGAHRFPGARELCDGVDNDCVALTTDRCLPGCTPHREQQAGDVPRRYLMCGGPDDRFGLPTGAPWQTAALVCAEEGFALARIDSDDEREAVWFAARDAELAPPIFLGGSDRAEEGTWRWTQGDDVFWPIAGALPAWAPGHPGTDPASGPEDCLVMTAINNAGALWMPASCDASLPFVCERPPPATP